MERTHRNLRTHTTGSTRVRSPWVPLKETTLAKVELRVYPPLSYKMSARIAGALALEQAINQGETLGDLLGRLSAVDPGAWQDIYDAQTHQLRPVIVTKLNGTALSSSTATQAPLSDGDQITFHLVYGGG
jgi:sulfur carrier protein ThiS